MCLVKKGGEIGLKRGLLDFLDQLNDNLQKIVGTSDYICTYKL